ncbi:MAG: RNA polymerase sigma factor [Tannerellaceae bacterium]|jgi:RNA polymerase sigma-70 factor (ECF subfamily)|nr:RNA polymerase sigma factor [Tannerellaceae bacterium]
MELETFKIQIIPLRNKLLNISRTLVKEEAEAEDIVQEAFLKLWFIRDRLDNYQSVEALAVMVTKNLALDKLKTRRPESETDLGMLETKERNPAEQLELQDSMDCIRHLISRLPTLQQTILRMKDIEGYEVEEIAQITGCREDAVRVNLSRARKKIREQFIAINQSGYAYR